MKDAGVGVLLCFLFLLLLLLFWLQAVVVVEIHWTWGCCAGSAGRYLSVVESKELDLYLEDHLGPEVRGKSRRINFDDFVDILKKFGLVGCECSFLPLGVSVFRDFEYRPSLGGLVSSFIVIMIIVICCCCCVLFFVPTLHVAEEGGAVLQDEEIPLEEVRSAFNMFDRRGDGKARVVELRVAMEQVGEDLTEAELNAILAEARPDKAGFVDLNHFIHLLTSIDDKSDCASGGVQEGETSAGGGGGSRS